jgi:hypothetical protein
MIPVSPERRSFTAAVPLSNYYRQCTDPTPASKSKNGIQIQLGLEVCGNVLLQSLWIGLGRIASLPAAMNDNMRRSSRQRILLNRFQFGDRTSDQGPNGDASLGQGAAWNTGWYADHPTTVLQEQRQGRDEGKDITR